MHSRQIDRMRTTYGILFSIATLFLVVAAICPVQATIYPGYGGWSTGPRSTGEFGVSMGNGGRSYDNYDHYDTLATTSNSGWTGGSYHVNGVDGWDGSTGFYDVDWRAYMNPGETKTWRLYIWAVPNSTPNDLALNWESAVYGDPLVSAKLELIQKPQGVSGGPDVGTVWTTPPSFILPFYSTSNGLTGYGFKFTLTAVPEPSSILALVSGIAGFGGIVLKRK